MSDFEFFLRTGRRMRPASGKPELKFNPWHDPNDGRFTFAGQGRRSGGFVEQGGSGGGAGGSWPARPVGGFRGFGGGGFGGGGAGGGWSKQPSKAISKKPKPPRGEALRAVYLGDRQQSRDAKIKNGYRYNFDSAKRTIEVSGFLHLQAHPRSRIQQANAGKPDRRRSDDGGHYIAARFNGPRDWFNHFAQDSNFNRGAYRLLEDGWGRDVRAGKKVFVDIVPHYVGASRRPSSLNVIWYVNGKRLEKTFPNEGKGN